MNFWSQFFPERSTHKDGFDLFLAFCVLFWEGDFGEIEQRCPNRGPSVSPALVTKESANSNELFVY